MRILIISEWPLFRMGLQSELSRRFRGVSYLEADSPAAVRALAQQFSQIDYFLIEAESRHYRRYDRRLVRQGFPSIVLSRHYGRRCLISRPPEASGEPDRQRFETALVKLVGAERRVYYDRSAYMAAVAWDQDQQAVAPPHSALSRVEQNVVSSLCDGLTNREIAHALNISVYTVKSHLGKIFKKLKVKSRTQLVLLAGQQDKIDRSFGT